MPKGPQGERRPSDVISNPVNVMRIAAGEEEDERAPIASAATELGKRGGATRRFGADEDEAMFKAKLAVIA